MQRNTLCAHNLKYSSQVFLVSTEMNFSTLGCTIFVFETGVRGRRGDVRCFSYKVIFLLSSAGNARIFVKL